MDNDVDFYDFCLLAGYWLETNCGPCECDRADFMCVIRISSLLTAFGEIKFIM